jgi:hypothetical protein
MPIELNQFIDQASRLGDQSRVYVSQDGDAVGENSALRGLKRLSSSAKKAENRQTLSSFMAAVSRHPAYETAMRDVTSLISTWSRQGKPLQARDIKQVASMLDMAAATTKGQTLVQGGQLPAGHATSFAHYAVAHNLPLDEGHLGQAVKAYLLDTLCSRTSPDSVHLTTLHGFGDKGAAMSAILRAARDPLDGANGFFAQQADALLANGLDHFSFQAFTQSFQTANTTACQILDSLEADHLRALSGAPNAKDTLAMLETALPSTGIANMDALLVHSIIGDYRLETEPARSLCVRNFMLEKAMPAVTGLMTAAHLPEVFDRALGHYPEVVSRAKTLLDANPGLGRIPTREQAAVALRQAVEEFIVGHEAVLHEFALMAQNPPIEIDPPLTPETMPRYLNAMLSGDAVLEPLLNDSVPIDGAFMTKLAVYGEALNSASHSFRGEFGSTDLAHVQRNALRLLMARRGVDENMYADMLNRAVARFGPIASDLASLNSAVQRGLGETGWAYQPVGLTAFRALEGHASVLLDLVPRQQLAVLRAASPEEPAPDDANALREDGQRRGNFLETHFEKESAIGTLSQPVREFALAHGLTLPQPEASAQTRAEGRIASALQTANSGVSELVQTELISDTGMERENLTPAFREMFAQASRHTDLTGIDINLLNPRDFSLPVRSRLQDIAATATREGRTVNAATLRESALAPLTEELQKVKAALGGIDALPESAPGERAPDRGHFTSAEKTIMKEMAQRHGLRDPNALAALMYASRSEPGALRGLSDPDATPGQLAECARLLTSAYLDAQGAIGNPKPAGNEDAMTIMVEMGMRLHGIDNVQARRMETNLSGPTAHTVAGAFNMAYGLKPQQDPLLIGVPAMMNAVRTATAVQSQGNTTVEPLFFSDTAEGLWEVPGGPNGCMNVLFSSVGQVISPAARALANHVPPFSREEWRVLLPVAEKMDKIDAHDIFKGMSVQWVSAAGAELLAAQRANGGQPLSNARIWQIIMGSPMPRGVKDEDFATRMAHDFGTRYLQSVQAAVPGIEIQTLGVRLGVCTEFRLSPKQMLALARPGATLNLADLCVDMHMSSLRTYDETTAYGLVADFRRRGKNTVMTFEDRNGRGFVTSPFSISDADNTPAHPHFQQIIAKVRSMTQSEAQTARVLQAFSQAGLASARIFSMAFPGIQLSEHGNFSVTAKQQADGKVVVDIVSDPSLPLSFQQQFTVDTDGSHQCTGFTMSRLRHAGT